jgi:FAD:protein FMN transferase
MTRTRYVNSRMRVALGTFIAIEAEGLKTQPLQRAVGAAFGAVAQVGQLMHPTRGGSDLVAIRDAAAGAALAVHPWTWEVLELAQQLHRLSGGVFDPCVPEGLGRLADLELPAPQLVRRHAPLRLDLGGIAKGYAVDRAIAALRAAGCTAGVVNAGGDVRVFGRRPRDLWCRGAGNTALQVHLVDAALACSGPSDRAVPVEHRGYYRRVGEAPVRVRAVAVSAATAVIADALTKCVMLSSSAESSALLRCYGARELLGGAGERAPRARRAAAHSRLAGDGAAAASGD